MVSVALFHTAGHTETGALQEFLSKFAPGLRFERRFPHCKKPAPKFGRTHPTPVQNSSGCTGQALIDAMLVRLKKYPPVADVILLVDDADCRFDSNAAYEEDCGTLQKEITSALGREVTFVALFAAPEIESWLIADWDNAFASWYGADVANALLYALSSQLFPKSSIETYGYPELPEGGCSKKLSDTIREAFIGLPYGKRYSKASDGIEMLRGINPANVAASCRTYFNPAYKALCALAANL